MIVNCPHCNEQVLISNLRCGIFIHAIMKKTGKQVNPHTTKSKIDALIKQKRIYGCGNSFSVIKNNDSYEVSTL